MVRWLATLALLILAACGKTPEVVYKATDITGADFGRQLALTDFDGRKVSLDTFKGKLVVLFFGYTHCPDVCPTTLSDVAQAMKLMKPEDAARVQAVFVSVDPERDLPQDLKAYITYFHPTFLGLTGTAEEIATAAKEFKIVYRKHVEPGASGYLVDHTAGSYVLDTQGRLRLFQPYAQPAADIAHDLTALLRG
jgi:protein SCO1/2